MSLSETDTQTGETVAEQLALLREDHAELRGLVLALHEELCYIRGQWPRLAEQVGDLHATLSAMQPLIQKYAATAGSPAARWARGRGRQVAEPVLAQHQCQDIAHMPGRGPAPDGCARDRSHRWNFELGCHDAGALCYG